MPADAHATETAAPFHVFVESFKRTGERHATLTVNFCKRRAVEDADEVWSLYSYRHVRERCAAMPVVAMDGSELGVVVAVHDRGRNEFEFDLEFSDEGWRRLHDRRGYVRAAFWGDVLDRCERRNGRTALTIRPSELALWRAAFTRGSGEI